MRDHHPYKLYGALLLAVVAGLVSLSLALFNQTFKRYVPVTLQISRAGLQLLPGSDVKVRGVLVGDVASITSDGTGATLHLRLDPGMVRQIPANVTAQLVPKTIFGEKYVDLVLPAHPSAQPLRSGDVIGADRSRPALEIDQALNDLLPVLRTVQPQQLDAALTAMATALTGRGAELGQTLVQLRDYLTQLDPHLPTMQHDLGALGSLGETYAQAAPALLRIARDVTVTSNTVTGARAQLAGFLSTLTSSADATRDLLARSANDIIQINVVNRGTLALLARYSPEYACLFEGINNVIPHIKVDVPKTGPFKHMPHVMLEFVPAYYGYRNPQDLPQFADRRGPNCYGLPNPPMSLPRVHYKDGTQNDPRFQHQPGDTGGGSGGTPAPPAGTPGASYSPDMGDAGTAPDRAAVDTLLAALTGTPAWTFPDISDLLWGPIARGTSVVVS